MKEIFECHLLPPEIRKRATGEKRLDVGFFAWFYRHKASFVARVKGLYPEVETNVTAEWREDARVLFSMYLQLAATKEQRGRRIESAPEGGNGK